MTTPFPFVSGQVLTAAQLNDIQNLPISDKTASYTLLVGDVTKRTIMNSASATTITVDDAIFTVGDVIQVANKGAGTTTITAGVGVTINTSGSLALAQYGGGYLLALSASTFTFFNLGGGVSYGTATGGSSSSITVSGQNYTLLDFTSDSNLVVTKTGLFDVLLLAGGGGGGGGINGGGFGGGAAGSFNVQTIYLTAATYTVDIGAGGVGSTGGNLASPQNGFSSSVGAQANGIIGVGGGSGAHYASGQDIKANVPGGGGGGAVSTTGAGPAATGFGFSGGNGGVGGVAGGGGSGSSANGSNSASGVGGAGGAGTSLSTFTGATITTTVGLGGAGGNLVGGIGTSGAANSGTGGQGGGGTGTNAGGAGGSGRVFVRFKV
jgi:hypothetical protein